MNNELILMAAVDEDWGIARRGKIPWHNPEDLQFFRQKTHGHALIVGRKTFETLREGRLSGRHLGICSRHPVKGAHALSDFLRFAEGFPLRVKIKSDIEAVTKDTSAFYGSNLDALLSWAKSSGQDVYVIGGAEVFKACLGICDRVILSHLEGSWGCDLFFPSLSKDFCLSSVHEHDTFVERQYTANLRAAPRG